jgi:hypothetical protein
MQRDYTELLNVARLVVGSEVLIYRGQDWFEEGLCKPPLEAVLAGHMALASLYMLIAGQFVLILYLRSPNRRGLYQAW